MSRLFEFNSESSFKNNGYLTLPHILPSQRAFNALYRQFNRLINVLRSNLDLYEQVNKASEEWLAMDDNASFYCNAPSKYADRTMRADKENKIYYQCNWEFINFFANRHINLYKISPELQYIHNFFRSLYPTIADSFEGLVVDIDKRFPGLENRLIKPGRAMPIVFKILKYLPDQKDFVTSPHVDKGAFTLIVNNDDKIKDKLVIGRNSQDSVINANSLAPPIINAVTHFQKTDAVIIPGAHLQRIGVDIEPSPHAVWPTRKERYSAIAFLLVHSLKETSKPNIKYLI